MNGGFYLKHISVLIKPASSLCNLRCNYCFYADVSSLREVKSYGRMKHAVAEQMIENIYCDLKDGDRLSLAFQGGEPTFAGLRYYEHIVGLIAKQTKRVEVNYAIQTNGTIINRFWCDFLKKHHFLVGLSIDGHPLYHDLNRLDAKGQGTFHRVLETKRLFDEYQIDYNILCVLTNPLAKEAKKVCRFIKEEKIEYIQFIPCLDGLEETTRSSYSLTPKRFASFYKQMFSMWLAELKKGNYISIKLFDDIYSLLVRQQVNACGLAGNCQIQYVIEADGSVYPCDFYVLDEYRMGYIQEQTLKELFSQPISMKFLCDRPETPRKCLQCPFFKVCHTGCKRMAEAMYIDEKNDFCGYQTVLNSFIPQLETIHRSLADISS